MLHNELDIIQKVIAKDQPSFEILYDHYSPRVYGLILRMTSNKELVEEIMQEVFLKLWNNIDKYDPEKSKLFTWLYQITRNTTLNKLAARGEKKNRQIDYTDRFKIDPSINASYEAMDIKGVVNKLEQKYIDVIDLVYFKAYTFKETAETLNVPLGTVKTRVRFALSELKKYYDYKSGAGLKSIAIILIGMLLWIK